MEYFILKFDEINTPEDNNALSYPIIISAENRKTAEKISSLVKIIKEDLDKNCDKLKLDTFPDDKADGYTIEEALDNGIINTTTYDFLHNYFITDEEEYAQHECDSHSDWNILSWSIKIDIILNYLLSISHKIGRFGIISRQCINTKIH